MFEVGQSVRYVNNAPYMENGVIKWGAPTLLTLGQTYVVSDIDKFENEAKFGNESYGISLIGLAGSRYFMWRFEPLIKTDIGVFTKLLAPVPAKVLEEV